MQLSNNMLNLKTSTVDAKSQPASKGRSSENSDVFSHILKNEASKVADKEYKEVVSQESSDGFVQISEMDKADNTVSLDTNGQNSEAKEVDAAIASVLSEEDIANLEELLSERLKGVEDTSEIEAIFAEFVEDLPEDVQIRLADFVEAQTGVITSSQLQQSVNILATPVNKLDDQVSESPKILFKEAQKRSEATNSVPVAAAMPRNEKAPETPVIAVEGVDESAPVTKDAIQNLSKAEAVQVGIDRSSSVTKSESTSSASFSEKLQSQQVDSKAQASVEALKDSAWGKSVGQRAIMMAQYGPRTIEIQLDPPELGTLQVRINLAQNDQINLQFSSSNAGVREALETHQSRLREMFEAAGVKLANTDISDGRGERNGEAKSFNRNTGNSLNSSEEKPFVEVNKPVGLVDFYA